MGKVDPITSKEELRRQVKDGLTRAEVDIKSPELAEQIAHWIRELPTCSQIATFSSLSGQEPDLAILHQLLPQHLFVYPRVESNKMLRFHLVSDRETMAKGAFGVREPDIRVHPPVSQEDIDLYLCPGMAFGRDGSRLGRGGGYYDRALAKSQPGSLFLGVCFPFQIFDSVPREEHDFLMTHVNDGDTIKRV